jgi:ABC-type uncharacterized transport system ATPase subunit
VEAIALPQRMTFVDRKPQQWTLRVEGEVGELIPALARFRIQDLEIIEPALEDVLRSFYRQESA